MAGFEELLTVEDVAEILNIEADTVRLWLRTGRLVGYKFGKTWRIARSTIVEFLRASRNVPEAEDIVLAS